MFFEIFCSFQIDFLPEIVGERYRMTATRGFRRRGVDALFLRNQSDSIVIVTMSLITYLIVKLVLRTTKKIGYLQRIFSWLNNSLEFGGLLLIF